MQAYGRVLFRKILSTSDIMMLKRVLGLAGPAMLISHVWDCVHGLHYLSTTCTI
jgi:hypothetical protein